MQKFFNLLPFPIAVNTLYQLVGKLITSLAAVLTIALIARSIGAEALGIYTKATVFAALFYMLSDFGFNAIFIRKFSSEEDFNQNFKYLFSLRLIIAAVLFVIASLIVLILPFDPATGSGFSPQAKMAAILANLTIISFAIFTTNNALFQSRLRYDLSVIASVGGSVATILLVFLAVYLKSSLYLFVAATVLGSALTALFSTRLARFALKEIRLKIDLVKFKQLIKETFPVGFSLVLNLIYFRVDIVLLSFLRPNLDVAIYGLAYKIFEFSLVVPTFLMNSAYPVFINYYKDDLPKFKKLITNAAWVLLLLSLIIGLFFWFLAPNLVLIIGGTEFASSAAPLKVLVLGLPFFFLSSLVMWLLLVFEKQKLLIPIYLSGAFLNLILNLIFIPKYGYIGASFVTVFSEAIILILGTVFLFKIRQSIKIR